jgi:phage-related baseplate assembly protein
MASNLVTTQPSRFSVIQPSLLPPLRALEVISTENNITARMAQLKIIWDKYDPPNAAKYDVENLEFDPLKIQAELAAFFEALVRNRVNQAVRAVTLAFSVGSDLDAIASRYPYGLPRKTTAAGTWNGPGTQEPDDTYRTRIWNSPSILSLSGPGQAVYESYVFWAMSAAMPPGELPIKHAAAFTIPQTGKVFVPILPMAAINMTWVHSAVDRKLWTLTPGAVVLPTPTQISTVYDFIHAPGEARMGLTDILNVTRPKVINTTIDADLYWFPGIDVDALIAATNKAVADLVVALNWLGADLTLLALEGAFAQAGMYRTIIRSPATDVTTDTSGVVNISSVRLRYIGSGE